MTCCYDRPGSCNSHDDPSKTRAQLANTFHQDLYYTIMRERKRESYCFSVGKERIQDKYA